MQTENNVCFYLAAAKFALFYIIIFNKLGDGDAVGVFLLGIVVC